MATSPFIRHEQFPVASQREIGPERSPLPFPSLASSSLTRRTLAASSPLPSPCEISQPAHPLSNPTPPPSLPRLRRRRGGARRWARPNPSPLPQAAALSSSRASSTPPSPAPTLRRVENQEEGCEGEKRGCGGGDLGGGAGPASLASAPSRSSPAEQGRAVRGAPPDRGGDGAAAGLQELAEVVLAKQAGDSKVLPTVRNGRARCLSSQPDMRKKKQDQEN